MINLTSSQLITHASSQAFSFFEKNKNWVVLLYWATATWKTALSLSLPQVSVINADSRQFFRWCDVVTDKIDVSKTTVPHYLINNRELWDSYTAWQRKKDASDAIMTIHTHWRLPCVVWGTGLYMDLLYKNYTLPEVPAQEHLRSQREEQEKKTPWSLHVLLTSIDPESAQVIHPKNVRYIIRALEIHAVTWEKKSDICREKPVEYPLLLLWLMRDPTETEKRIADRIDVMISHWMLDETRTLIQSVRRNSQALTSIWYRQALSYLYEHDDATKRILDLQWFTPLPIKNLWELKEQIIIATRQLAKKQRTWMRSYIRDSEENPKDGVEYMFCEVR